jgi:predicted dehydrogenase
MADVRLMTLDPGHFHAALVQKEMYAGVAPRAHVFASLGPDLIEHLKRIAAFNSRVERPTAWEEEVHTGPDYFERLLAERPGNVVVLSGRNRPKIDRILQSIQAGLNVLADKPWIIATSDLPKLDTALAEADAKGLVAYDIMTERFEVTSILQRALVNSPAAFGTILPGAPDDPSVYMESVHYLMKTVAGAPNLRPSWFFDSSEVGEGLSDVGTHLVDLVQWTLFPDTPIDHRRDVAILGARRWPTVIDEAGFRRVTGAAGFPPALSDSIAGGRLEYYCNNLVTYSLRGVHVALNVAWDWEAEPGGGDTHFAVYKGTLSRVEIRQTRADASRPELYVVPNDAAAAAKVFDGVRGTVAALQAEYPGVTAERRGTDIHVAIPDAFRVGHEAHFAQVAASYFRFLRDRSALPAWERPNMLAKYYVTTAGTEMSRQHPPQTAPRIAPR